MSAAREIEDRARTEGRVAARLRVADWTAFTMATMSKEATA
jgi:hypothetical protein